MKSSKALAWVMAAMLAVSATAFGGQSGGRPAHQTSAPVLLDDLMVPFGLGIVPPMQFPSDVEDVVFLRLSLLWGVNQNVHYLDVGGLGTVTMGDFGGVQVAGLWNEVMGTGTGLQVAGLLNYGEGDFYGVQVSGLLNYSRGLGTFHGVQVACANCIGSGAGVQLGLINSANDFCGLQVGLFNAARHMKGLQLGILNYIDDATLPLLPLLNIGF